MNYTWVIGTYKGKDADKVKAHANEGVGYFVRSESGRGTNYEVTVAFRRANDSPIPPHLMTASVGLSEKLDEKYWQRSGMPRMSVPKTTSSIVSVLGKRNYQLEGLANV